MTAHIDSSTGRTDIVTRRTAPDVRSATMIVYRLEGMSGTRQPTTDFWIVSKPNTGVGEYQANRCRSSELMVHVFFALCVGDRSRTQSCFLVDAHSCIRYCSASA